MHLTPGPAIQMVGTKWKPGAQKQPDFPRDPNCFLLVHLTEEEAERCEYAGACGLIPQYPTIPMAIFMNRWTENLYLQAQPIGAFSLASIGEKNYSLQVPLVNGNDNTGETVMDAEMQKKALEEKKAREEARAKKKAEKEQERAAAAAKRAEEKAAKQAARNQGGAISRPREGTSCGKIWAICDESAKANNGVPVRKTVFETCEKMGLNPHTISTQYGRWREFHGLVKKQSDLPANVQAATAPQAPTA